jgi:hypothetical protein
MTTSDFTATIIVDQTPGEVFNAINNVRGWWSEEIEGPTEKLNDVFNYHFEDIHRCQIKLIEVVPDQKVVWQVLENYFKPGIFGETSDKRPAVAVAGEAEWVNTTIHFEITEKKGKTQIRFTHKGLVPEYECFEICESGWNHYIRESLLGLITTGKGQPNSAGAPMTADEVKIRSGISTKN